MPAICPSCRKPLPEAANVCPFCGRALAQAAPAAARGPAPGLIPDYIASGLCYLFVPAVVFLFLRPYRGDALVRFHAVQALLFLALAVVVNLVFAAISFLAVVLVPLALLAEFITWLVLVIKGFGGEMFGLPLLGDYAERLAGPAA